MPKFTDEKTGQVKFECWECHGVLRKNEIVCFECGKMDQDAFELRREYYKIKASHRKARQLKEFAERFDKSLTEAVGSILTRIKKITTKELVEAMESCGLADDYRIKDMADENKKKNAWQSWAYHRAIGLMKALNKQGKCHIGTATTPGHPYVFYLDKKAEEMDIQGILQEYVENS